MEIARRAGPKSRAELGSISSSRCQITRTPSTEVEGARMAFLANELDLVVGVADRTVWWSQTGSNRRPPACKAGALPTELWPRQRTDDRRRRTDRKIRHLSSVF